MLAPSYIGVILVAIGNTMIETLKYILFRLSAGVILTSPPW